MDQNHQEKNRNKLHAIRDLSMKSRSNNSSDMSVDDQKPSNDSLIYKSEINELEEIKAEDSYEESDINDF